MYERNQIQQHLVNPEEDLEQKSVAEALRKQWKSSQKNFLIFKIAVMITILLLLLLNAVHNFIHHDSSIICLKDIAQDWTLSLTKFLKDNKSFKNAIIILSSAFIDIGFIIFAIRWICLEKSLRLFITTFPFYLFRGLFQRAFSMRFPDDFIFENPGIFSIGVPYFKTNDFFYSGHVGLCTIFFLEFKKDKVPFLKIFSLVGITVNFVVLLVTRGHYFIDLVIGIIIAHYLYILGLWIEENVKKSNNKFYELFRANRANEEIPEESILQTFDQLDKDNSCNL